MSKIVTYDITYDNERFLKLINQPDVTEIILFSLEESLDWKRFIETKLSEKIKLIQNNTPFRVIVNDTCRIHNFGETEFIKLPAFLLKTVYKSKQGQLTNPHWNSESKKGLILTGKPNKENRIGFLIECVKSGTLKNHIYSFFPPKPEEYIKKTKEIFYSLCDWDYDEFCKEYKNNPDGANVRNGNEDMHYSGFPYSVDLFQQTSISVVLETNVFENGNNLPDFSEKTYKAIINKHPFLVWNEPESLWFLRKYGFYTFEDYMEYKDYDSIKDPFEKNKIVIKNLNYFLKNYKSFESEINDKIEHNYNNMIKIYNDFKSKYPIIYEGLCGDFFHR